MLDSDRDSEDLPGHASCPRAAERQHVGRMATLGEAMNAISYFEFAGTSSAKLAEFYGSVFGWKSAPGPFPNYVSLTEGAGAGLPGGFRQEEKPEVVLYVKVEDLQAILDAVVQAGGKVLIPPTLVPGVVHFALFEDPCGNRTGIVV